MRVGFAVPQFGVFADPDLSADVSRRLEGMGYDSLWVSDRILGPLDPSDPYPVPSSNGVIPPQFATNLDPLAALTVAALNTRGVRLGTSILNALFMPPVLLARSLTTLDLISHGRLDVGIGLGWMRDEYSAVKVPWKGRGARLDEVLDVLQEIWTSDVVEHEGELCNIPPSHIFPKPLQKPHPPIYLAGFASSALERVGRRADGWLGLAMPLEKLTGLWNKARQEAERVGRDPASVRVALRINPKITVKPEKSFPTSTSGTVAQVCEYIFNAGEAGADEAFVDVQTTTSSVNEMMDIAEAIIKGMRGS